jgi:SpoVK/Ycf46/Vps4 family AAA+-type ATPase
VFAEARRNAPAVLFFDEVDAIGGRRSRMGVHATMRSVVSVLLTELDGAVRDNSGVFTVAASNLPWDIDPALRRPGRLDKTVFVPPPDHSARVGILANRLSGTQIGLDLDLGRIASMTEGCSGADVSAVVDDAIDTAIAATLEEGHEVPVGQAELEAAAARTRPSITDWVTMATVAAESSDDEELYGPFLDWLQDRRRW